MRAIAFILGMLLWVGASASVQKKGKLPSSGKIVMSYSFTGGHGGADTSKKSKVIIYWKGKKYREEQETYEGNLWLISDGKTAYQYNVKTRMAFPKALPRVEDVISDIPKAFKSLKKVGSETVRGKPCDIYTGESPGGKARIWIGRETGISMKFTTQGMMGGTMTKEVTELKTGIKLSDSLFQLPSGARRIEP